MSQHEGLDDLDLTTWALDRLLNAEYECFQDEDGKIEMLELGAEFGSRGGDPTVIEEALKGIPSQEEWEALWSLKEHRTPDEIDLVRPDYGHQVPVADRVLLIRATPIALDRLRTCS